MIEQGIYFALGCIVTALLALLFAPVFWRRALRLTRQRLALQVPLSMQEILAQRDQIRAEFAVERLRIEQAMEAVQETKAADMAEIGRLTRNAATLGQEVTRLRQSEQTQQAEIERRRREAAEASAEIGALHMVLHGDDRGDDSWRARAETAIAQCARLQTEIASLKSTPMSSEAEASKSAVTALRTRLEAAVAQAARHEAASLTVRRELDAAKSHIRRLEENLDGSKPGENAPVAPVSHPSHGADGAVRDQDAAVRETIHALGLAVADLRRQARDHREPSRQDRPRSAVGDEVARPLGVA